MSESHLKEEGSGMIIEELKNRWWRRVVENNLENVNVVVKVRGLSPEEAIGRPAQFEFPLLKGREVMIQAELNGALGQAYTDEPKYYEGSLRSINQLKLSTNNERGIFIAAANATYRYLGLITNTVHCKNEGPELCSKKIAEYLASTIKPDAKLLMIGFQPAIAYYLSKKFNNFRVTDMDPTNIGQMKHGILIETYESNRDAISWSDVVLATGTTIVNNTIDDIVRLSKGKRLIFYGVTIASASYEFNFERLCFNST
jgi:uncharacterized protein (DUF4213/DUF364 family)